VVTFGEMSEEVEQEIRATDGGGALAVRHAGDLEAAVLLAVSLARPGDAVLLSPGGTSFDAYRDFEERYSLLLPVTEASVRYLQPARYDDLLRVETSLEEIRRASACFTYRLIRDDGLVLATGRTLHACIDLDGKVRRLPEELVTNLSSGEALASR
jgi:YbgC/YbaW family acyl-CoA thioester hydrolase